MILCLPLLGSSLTNSLLSAINSLRLAQLPNTTLIAVHLTSVTPFLPAPQFNPEPPSIPESTTTPVTHPANFQGYSYLQTPRSSTGLPPKRASTQIPTVPETSELLLTSEYTDTSPRTHTAFKTTETPNMLGRSKEESLKWKRYSPPGDMSQATKSAMLVLTVTDSGVSVEQLFNQSPASSNFTRHTEVSVRIMT
jgi:hypothetical protein